jgi:sn-glycerol 3-phosphate transport system substrate-binding protein
MQVFDAGTGVMMGAQGAIKPVADILKRRLCLRQEPVSARHRGYYSKPEGTMLSFPYNSSSPILYYNKDIFQKAGLDVNAIRPRPGPRSGMRRSKIKESGARLRLSPRPG